MISWVLMPIRNGCHLTWKAIDTILRQRLVGDVRVLVIDNNSSDGSSEYLRSMYPKVRVIRRGIPVGVARAWNLGLRYIFDGEKADQVLVVNNDVELLPPTYFYLKESGHPFVTAVGVGSREQLVYVPEVNPISEWDRVKISHFLKRGIQFEGIVHAGTNTGYEIPYYQTIGSQWTPHLRVMGFEPLKWAHDVCKQNYPDVVMHNVALSDYDGEGVLNATGGDGVGSSLLQDLATPGPTTPQKVEVRRLDSYDLTGYDLLVVDVQGLELEVLKGCGDKLQQFKGLNVECSRVPTYLGEPPAHEVIEWLAEHGFVADTPVCDHDDIMFIREDIYKEYGIPDPRKSRPHPDFSCYLITRECWEKVGEFDDTFEVAFCEDWDYHCRMHQLGISALCIDYPYLHWASQTVKLATDSEHAEIDSAAERNREYFARKWGFAGGTSEYYDFFKR